MNSRNEKWNRRKHRQPRLTFAPLAWLKLQFLCHLGDTEIGGFGITAKDDLLYVEDFVTVRQRTSMVTVAMDDQAVADFTDRCVDAGLPPQRFLRVWCHPSGLVALAKRYRRRHFRSRLRVVRLGADVHRQPHVRDLCAVGAATAPARTLLEVIPPKRGLFPVRSRSSSREC